MKKHMNSLKYFNGRVRRKMTGFAAVAALLGMTAGALPSVNVSTAIGSGADAYVSGWGAGINQDSGSSNNSGLWCRKALTNENQVVALRFDLSGSPRAGYSTFSIDLINYRTNATPKSLAFYAVRDGAVGEDNNGSAPGYSDNNWDENSILFSTMPGLHWANTSTTDQGPNTDAIYLGTISASLMVTNKGQINSFRSTALNDFMQTNADDSVTFLVVGADENEAGSNYLIRISSKELTSLDGSAPAAAAGTFAPRVVYDPPATCVDPIILQGPTSQTGNIGSTVTFTSWFGYDANTTFKWQLSTDNGSSWTDISGANSDRYTTPTIVGSDNGKQYRCIAMGCTTSATNTPATLSVSGVNIWVGPASGGEWNTGANWSLGTAADSSVIISFIGAATNVNYNLPMSASLIGPVTNRGVLNINTNGFNSGTILNLRPGGTAAMYVNYGGAVNITGNLGICSNGVAAMVAGSTVTISGGLNIGSDILGGNNGTGTVGSFGSFTNLGGTLTAGSTSLNPKNQSIGTSARLVIAGGTNTLGALSIARAPGGNSAPPALGSDGVVISNGVVNMTSISLGNNAHGVIYLVDGLVTNSGVFNIQNTTATRPARFIQRAGVFVNANTVTMSGSADTVYAALGGTNSVYGFALNGTTIYFTNSTRMLIGSGGISGSGTTINALLNSGGVFGASADWNNSVSITLNGGTFDCQDGTGTPHNIYSSGVLKGSGALTKTGNGTLTLDAANTYSGNTFINAGTLALGGSGSLNSSAQIFVGSGTTFDVSQAVGYTLPAAKTLSGFGSVAGDVALASTAILNPGSNTLTGTLTFSNSITETGGAVNHFDLSSNPSGPNNDLIVVQGDINVSGSGNVMEIVGGGASGSIHPLFKYSGTFNGDLSSFTIVGATGNLINDTTTTPKTIALVVATAVRSPTNTVWVGNSITNYWDVLSATNWLNGGTLDYFVTGDAVTFNNVGLSNPNVDITTTVQPSSVTVNASGDYVFGGAGGIGGTGSITKTNTGKLTIQSVNLFTGGMNIKQGTVSVSTLADDNTPSPLGQTGALLVDGGALEYTGSSTTWTRPLTMGVDGGAISLPSGVTLTYSGSIGGSGSLAKNDLGNLTLTTANSYTGGTRLKAGTLTLNNALSAGSGDITFTGNSTLELGSVKPANTIVLSNYAGVVTGGNSGGATGIKNVVGSSNLTVSVTTGVFDLSGDMSTYSGSIALNNAGGSIVRLNGSTGSKLATWDLGSGIMDLNVRNKSSTPYLFGAIKGGPSSTLTGPTGSDSAGRGAATYQIGDNGLSTTFEGVIKNGSDASQVLSIIKTGTGTLTLSGVNTYTGTTVVSNGMLQVNGSLATGSAVTVAGGILSGIGTISGTTTLNSGATLQAGNDRVGTLTFSGNLTLNAASTNLFAVTTSGGASNLVVVSGQLTPNGSVVRVVSGSPLAIGTYPLFTYSTINGSFNVTPVFDVAPAAIGSVVDTGSGQINLVISTGPSSPASITNSISGNALTLTWPAGENWRLQGQTNNLSSGLNPSGWGTVSGPGISDGSAAITVDPNQPTVFYRLVYP